MSRSHSHWLRNFHRTSTGWRQYRLAWLLYGLLSGAADARARKVRGAGA